MSQHRPDTTSSITTFKHRAGRTLAQRVVPPSEPAQMSTVGTTSDRSSLIETLPRHAPRRARGPETRPSTSSGTEGGPAAGEPLGVRGIGSVEGDLALGAGLDGGAVVD